MLNTVLLSWQDGNSTRPLTADDKTRINSDVIDSFAEEGLRTICLAYRVIPPDSVLDLNDPDHVEQGLTCIGPPPPPPPASPLRRLPPPPPS